MLLVQKSCVEMCAASMEMFSRLNSKITQNTVKPNGVRIYEVLYFPHYSLSHCNHNITHSMQGLYFENVSPAVKGERKRMWRWACSADGRNSLVSEILADETRAFSRNLPDIRWSSTIYTILSQWRKVHDGYQHVFKIFCIHLYLGRKPSTVIGTYVHHSHQMQCLCVFCPLKFTL